MANENLPVGGAGDPAATAGYQKERHKVRDLVTRRNALQRQLAEIEQSIFNSESEYLENTPSGNIITGFDNYTKGASSAAAQRRRTGLMEQNRVFTRSSISYNALHPDNVDANSSASTPAAPTPVSGSFKDKDGATPTSSTAENSKKGNGGGSNSNNNKKKKKAAAAADDDDSDTDAREAKKVRTSFGAGGRK